LEDCRISAKSIAEQLGISSERDESIIHEDLDKLVACFLLGRAKDLSPLVSQCKNTYGRNLAGVKLLAKFLDIHQKVLK
jgi:hypothetical protein